MVARVTRTRDGGRGGVGPMGVRDVAEQVDIAACNAATYESTHTHTSWQHPSVRLTSQQQRQQTRAKRFLGNSRAGVLQGGRREGNGAAVLMVFGFVCCCWCGWLMFATANAIINDEKLLHTRTHTGTLAHTIGHITYAVKLRWEKEKIYVYINPFGIVLQINMKRAKRRCQNSRRPVVEWSSVSQKPGEREQEAGGGSKQQAAGADGSR